MKCSKKLNVQFLLKIALSLSAMASLVYAVMYQFGENGEPLFDNYFLWLTLGIMAINLFTSLFIFSDESNQNN